MLGWRQSMAELEAHIQVRVSQATQEQFTRTKPPMKHPPLGNARRLSGHWELITGPAPAGHLLQRSAWMHVCMHA